MSCLSTTLFGRIFDNPIFAASGPHAGSGSAIRKLLDAGAGGVVSKTIAPSPSDGSPKVWRIGEGMLNRDRFSERPLESWLTDIVALKGNPVIVSIVADTPEGLAQMAKNVTAAGAETIELGLACPNTTGLAPASDPVTLYEFCVAVREATNLPFSVKLAATPHTEVMTSLASSAVSAGANALTISDTIPGVSVDTRTGSLRLNGPGGFSGPGIKPLSMKAIYDVRKAGITCPIFGVGGICSADDALEYLMLGVQAVQLCTAILIHGRRILADVVAGLKTELEARGMSVDEIRGQALGNNP